jgi:penicillin amidase
MIVDPVRPDRAIAHMPGGQSEHPLSPWYRAGHAAWAKGEPTGLLAGEPVSRLVLVGE